MWLGRKGLENVNQGRSEEAMSKQRLCLWKEEKIMALPTYCQTKWTKNRGENWLLKALNKSAVFLTTDSSKPWTIFSWRSPAVLFTHLCYNLGLWFILTDSLQLSIFAVKWTEPSAYLNIRDWNYEDINNNNEHLTVSVFTPNTLFWMGQEEEGRAT